VALSQATSNIEVKIRLVTSNDHKLNCFFINPFLLLSLFKNKLTQLALLEPII